ncbi:multiubiquitin domain-containing protein [Demequina globuliformis]|uniref:multiubiquitin domain-containing protein n=1 Tax=Demequina globuliformis TaxID=676202 RepID=UPI000780F623|nr:multiubiquitin domain-containing protein [Demequina globuliformis]
MTIPEQKASPADDNDRGKPATTIIINTRPHEWTERSISFEQVLALTYPNQPVAANEEARVEFSRGVHGNGQGSLRPGQSVPVKKGMVFDAYVTVRS